MQHTNEAAELALLLIMQAAAARHTRELDVSVAWILVVLQLCLCIAAGVVSICEGTSEWTIQLSQGEAMFAAQAKQAYGAIHHSSCFLTPVVVSQGLITCQLRSSITGMLLRKLLLVPSYAKADAGTADVQTLMSIGENMLMFQTLFHRMVASW
jgi:hypothetical protein